MRDTDEVEAIVTQAARLPAVASACGTAPRFFPHTTTAAFAQMAEPPPQIVVRLKAALAKAKRDNKDLPDDLGEVEEES